MVMAVKQQAIISLGLVLALLNSGIALANDHSEAAAQGEAHPKAVPIQKQLAEHEQAEHDEESDQPHRAPASESKPKKSDYTRQGMCGVIENVEGVVEVLSSDRKTLLPVHERSDLECDSWVSTAQGWIRIRHRAGFQIQIGPDSFLKVAANDEHLTVFKGILYGRASQGQGELRMATANSRVRMKNASGMLIYQEQDAFTQLTAVEGQPSLENRFSDQARITLKPGESTTFHANLKRISPTTPKAASVASLRPKLFALHVEEGWISKATNVASSRMNRKFASVPGADSKSSEEKERRQSDYSRAPASHHASEDDYLARRWKEKTRIFEKRRTDLLKEISEVKLEE